MTIIYCLKCDGEIFYIGKTVNIKKRMDDHIQKYTQSLQPVKQYISQLLKSGKDIQYEKLAECSDEDALKIETEFIKKYKYSPLKNVANNPEYLNEIERQVLILMANDKETDQIAATLFKSVRTIEKIKINLKKKANVKTLTGLIMWAVNKKIINTK